MNRFLLILLILLFSPLLTAAQDPADSLMQVWKNQTLPDTTRLNALKMISWNVWLFRDQDSALSYTDKQYNFAKSRNLERYMADALHTKGVVFFLKGDYTTSLEHYKNSLAIRQRIKDKKGIGASLNNIGMIYENQGEFSKAIEDYSASLKIDEELKNYEGVAASANNIANIYLEQKNYKQVQKYCSMALELGKKYGNKDAQAKAYNTLGIISKDQGQYEMALEYYMKSAVLKQELGNEKGLASAWVNIGNVYQKMAEKHRSGDDQEYFQKATEYYSKGYSICEKLNDKKGMAASLINISNAYAKKGDSKRVVAECTRALNLATEVGAAMEMCDAAKCIWEAEKKLGNYRAALEKYELYISLRDTIESIQNQKEVLRHEFKSEYEHAAAADSIRSAEQKKVDAARIAVQAAEIKAKKFQQALLFGGLGLVIVFALFIFNRFRVTQRQKKIIEEKNIIIEKKQKEIVDSIQYAKRIQKALITNENYIEKHLKRLRANK